MWFLLRPVFIYQSYADAVFFRILSFFFLLVATLLLMFMWIILETVKCATFIIPSFFKFDSKLCSYWLFLSEKRFPLILLSHCENRLFLRFKGKNQFNHSVRSYVTTIDEKNKVKSQTCCSHLSQKLKNMLFNGIARSILK